MNTEPTGIPDEPTTAQRLAQDHRFTYQPGMQVWWRGKRHTIIGVEVEQRCVHLVEADNGIVKVSPYRDGKDDDPATYRDTIGVHGTGQILPCLDDDVTGDALMFRVRIWALNRKRAWSQVHDGGPVRVDVGGGLAHGAGPTLGDAAGACLLACWALADGEGES